MDTDFQHADKLHSWLIECEMAGIDPDLVSQALLSQGIGDEQLKMLMLPSGEAGPYLQAGKRIADQQKRLEWLLRVYEYNFALMPEGHTVVRRKNLKQDEFLREYYAANRPVILTDMVKAWPATKKWTLPYLKAELGNIEVEYVKTHPDRETMRKTHEKMPFGQFLDILSTLDNVNDYYITSYNNPANVPLVEALLKDVTRLPDFLDRKKLNPTTVFPWIGPAGTHTALHIDPSNGFLCQVTGHKKIYLIPPHHMPHLYLENDFFSPVNLYEIDMARYPKAAYAKPLEVTLCPGEALFIPVAWWHQIVALDRSISLTLTNFVFPNNYPPISTVYPAVKHDPGNSLPKAETDQATTSG